MTAPRGYWFEARHPVFGGKIGCGVRRGAGAPRPLYRGEASRARRRARLAYRRRFKGVLSAPGFKAWLRDLEAAPAVEVTAVQ